jgi:hypothetical protein
MQFGNHSYLAIYLVGCLVSVGLVIMHVCVVCFVNWFTKATIFQKNMKKLGPPETQSWQDKASVLAGLIFLYIILSWIATPYLLWQIFADPLRALRESLTSVPEEIKLLRFPIRNNPDMPRESVWAYVLALSVKGGGIPANPEYVRSNLLAIKKKYPGFRDNIALETLKSLIVVNFDLFSEVLDVNQRNNY